jgi:chromosome partitioning related protein ParA
MKALASELFPEWRALFNKLAQDTLGTPMDEELAS